MHSFHPELGSAFLFERNHKFPQQKLSRAHELSVCPYGVNSALPTCNTGDTWLFSRAERRKSLKLISQNENFEYFIGVVPRIGFEPM